MQPEHNWHRTDEQGKCNLRTKGGEKIHRVLVTDLKNSRAPVRVTYIAEDGIERLLSYMLDGKMSDKHHSERDIDWTEPTVDVVRWVRVFRNKKTNELTVASLLLEECEVGIIGAVSPFFEHAGDISVTIPLPASVAKAVQG